MRLIYVVNDILPEAMDQGAYLIKQNKAGLNRHTAKVALVQKFQLFRKQKNPTQRRD